MKNKEDSALVSIITVVYNGEKYLRQTIESVKNQTYKNIEYIIIDGGSTDDTLNIVEEYRDFVSKVVSEPDNGLYDAMNKGIGLANGVLIGIINSDDWYELDAVEIMVNAFKDNPNSTIFHADRFDINDLGEKTIRKFNSSVFKFKYYGMTYNHPSMFITKEEYNEHLYNPNLRSHSDYQFVLEAFIKNKENFNYIPVALVNYRLDGISSQMPMLKSSRVVYNLRRELGYTHGECIFSFLFMRIATLVIRIKNINK